MNWQNIKDTSKDVGMGALGTVAGIAALELSKFSYQKLSNWWSGRKTEPRRAKVRSTRARA